MPETDTELAQSLIRRGESLKSERSAWDGFWQDIADYVMPRKAEIASTAATPGTARDARLFDSTAIRANQTLANGQLSWMTPHEARWFAYDAPDAIGDNDVAQAWFRRCSDIVQAAIARSNFYSEIHELYLDRGAFGTSVFYVESGRNTPLLFQSWPIGSFSLAEDDEGYVDTAFRELEMSPRQAEMMFGRENLSTKLQKILEKAEPGECDQKHKFLHGIYPRDPQKIDPRKADPENMPVASVYVEIGEKKVCRCGGYRELPFMATRYLKWGRSVYGWSPSWMALPDARQLNFLEKQLDALAEITAFPRMLVPNNFEGDMDLRAGGVTYYDPGNPNGIPKEWATSGRYDVGLDRANRKQKSIEDAFHVDLFQMFAQLQKQMTAREVAERSSEKLIQFSPTFARMTTELFNPLLQRVFALLLRSGAFPPPPREVLVSSPHGVSLPEPKVSYSSRIALAIKSLENSAFSRTMEMVMPLSQMRPDVLDNFDFDKILRQISRNDGIPENWMLDMESVKQSRAARAQAQQQDAQMQQAQQLADAAHKAGSIRPESAVGQALEGAMQG